MRVSGDRGWAGRRTARWLLCAFLIALGLAVLAGWMFRIEHLKSIVPGLSTMKFNAALCFVLTGLGLWVAGERASGRRPLAIACGTATAAIGFVTLLQYVSGNNFGIDQLFVADRGTLRGSGHPGRMSPLTATAWMALGSAVILLAVGRSRRAVIAAHMLVSYAGFMAVLAAAGYAFGAEAFLGIGFYTAMAFHTAVGLIVAVAAALTTRAEEGWLAAFADSPSARALLGQLLPIAFILPVALGGLLMLGSALGAFNAAFGFALFIPCTVIALLWVSLRVARTASEAETELREREGQLSAFVSQSTAGFAQVDVTGRFTLINDRFCEIAGRSRDELLTLRMQDITHPDDLAQNLPLFERAVGGGAPFGFEKRYVRPDGSSVWVNNSVSVIRRSNGEPYGILAITLDVTERRNAEAAIRESEARLRALTDNLPGGMVYQISTGVDGSERRFLFVSQSHLRLTGIPAEEVLADPTIPYELILPEDRPPLVQAEVDAIADMSSFDVEARFRRRDGEVRWCRIISAPRLQPDGSIVWDGIQLDITERKKLEEDLHRLNETLEERVLQRGMELEAVHEQLRQSQKLEAMGQLTGGVAHDFNNLLSPIIGSLDLIQRKLDTDDRTKRLIDGALQSAERAKVLVQRLLAFARRQPLQTRSVDISELLEGMRGLAEATVGPAIKVVTAVEPGLSPAQADANQLELAILNLTVNARDAMPRGGTLTMSAAAESVAEGEQGALPAGDYVRIAIADTGVGMDEETAARAVEPFFSTKGLGRGTGLGLSMVHGLAAQLGGEMKIRSRPGAGTVVELWLPGAERLEAAEVASAAPHQTASGQGLVLLVDDEELVRTSTYEMLAELGYEVVEASSAEEALQLIEQGLVPDTVVTDHLMPGMTGADLARRLKSGKANLPVLIISGYADVGGIAPDLQRLGKPFRQADLAAALAELRKSIQAS